MRGASWATKGKGTLATSFLAIDFETAARSRTTACALGLAVVRQGRIVRDRYFLIRPPKRQFTFTHIHGLSWDDVCGAPRFCDLWPQLKRYIDGADFLVAHNASFDSAVLRRCCEHYGIEPESRPFICTLQLARSVLRIKPARLSDVCGRLGIPLRHHDALSDARACGEILLHALKSGWAPVV